MTVRTDRAPATQISDKPSVRWSHHVLWLMAVFVAVAIAAVAGVTFTAYLTRPAATNGTVYHGGDPTDSPTEVTKAYLEAMRSNDQARAREVLCPVHHDNPFGRGAQDPMLGTFTDLNEVSNDGATAKITVTLTFEQGSPDAGALNVAFTVVRESGGWYVCDVEQVDR
jgi:hypothetical protein